MLNDIPIARRSITLLSECKSWAGTSLAHVLPRGAGYPSPVPRGRVPKDLTLERRSTMTSEETPVMPDGSPRCEFGHEKPAVGFLIIGRDYYGACEDHNLDSHEMPKRRN